LVIDGTRSESLNVALEIISNINDNIGTIPFVVAVNKCDLPWELSDSTIENALSVHNCKWFKTSAKTGENVDEAFTPLGALLLIKKSQ